MDPRIGALALAAVVLAAAGLWLVSRGRAAQRASGVPAGRVLYSDTGMRRDVVEPLVSRRLGLVGKPDYLLERVEGGRRVVIPVEVKSGRAPALLHEGHRLQAGAYCLLVEEMHGAPPYALVRYADRTLPVPFTDALRADVLEAAAGVRATRQAAAVPRSHESPERCAACGYRTLCDQALSA